MQKMIDLLHQRLYLVKKIYKNLDELKHKILEYAESRML